jgi:hypothetical protein
MWALVPSLLSRGVDCPEALLGGDVDTSPVTAVLLCHLRWARHHSWPFEWEHAVSTSATILMGGMAVDL